jgi:hypothetical protein
MAPFGAASFVLGIILVRRDEFRDKRLMVLSAILIVALVNPFYIYNLIAFLSQQYFIASKGRFMDELVTNPLNLRGLSEVLFGTTNLGLSRSPDRSLALPLLRLVRPFFLNRK